MPHNIKEKEMPQLNFNNVPKLTGPPTRVHTGQILHTIPITILNFQEKLSKIYTVFSGYKSSAKQNGKTVKEKKKSYQPVKFRWEKRCWMKCVSTEKRRSCSLSTLM